MWVSCECIFSSIFDFCLIGAFIAARNAFASWWAESTMGEANTVEFKTFRVSTFACFSLRWLLVLWFCIDFFNLLLILIIIIITLNFVLFWIIWSIFISLWSRLIVLISTLKSRLVWQIISFRMICYSLRKQLSAIKFSNSSLLLVHILTCYFQFRKTMRIVPWWSI